MFASLTVLALVAGADPVQPCPPAAACQTGPYAPPFCTIPTPTPLKAGPMVEPRCGDVTPLCKSRFFAFENAAHFPVPTYDRCGFPTDTKALVIYEGMLFERHPKGKYSLAFTTTIPEQSVTLHLQLEVTLLPCVTFPQNPPFVAQTMTLTLPPIRLKAPPTSGSSLLLAETDVGDPFTFHVRHEGFSYKLLEFDEEKAVGSVTVRRIGSARFERPPPKLFADAFSNTP